MKQITPHIYQIELGFVNAFLIADKNATGHTDLTLIDTGMPGSTPKIFDALRKEAFDPADLRRIILTHAHSDHSGSAAELQNQLKIPIWAHAHTATLVKQGLASRRPLVPTPGLFNWLIYHLAIKRAPQKIDPVPVDSHLSHGEILPLAGGIRVIETPGHAEGHLSLLVQNDDLLIVADACANVMGLGYTTVYEDFGTGRNSLEKVAALTFDKAVFGHGKPILVGAAQKFQAKFQ
jgi:glyoxylase-like metal-dependent hydrolase (beta-lactamase superfamily II)